MQPSNVVCGKIKDYLPKHKGILCSRLDLYLDNITCKLEENKIKMKEKVQKHFSLYKSLPIN